MDNIKINIYFHVTYSNVLIDLLEVSKIVYNYASGDDIKYKFYNLTYLESTMTCYIKNLFISDKRLFKKTYINDYQRKKERYIHVHNSS